MDSEKVIFIILALVFSIFSMYIKSKKQKRSVPEKEQADTDFSSESDMFTIFHSEQFLRQSEVEYVQENSNIYPKKDKKKTKEQNFKKENLQAKTPKIVSQDIDLESEISLLEGFEGSELQKVFVLSEIFKNTNN
jgi:uncharacterized protein YpmB